MKRLLDSHGTPTFLCDPVPGEDVHEVAADGLAAARLMVAFCSETYGGSSSRDLNFREIGSGITKIPKKWNGSMIRNVFPGCELGDVFSHIFQVSNFSIL